MSDNNTSEEERETVCGNCGVALYQVADPNNIHWYHSGTGDVRCPARFAQPVSRASVAAPQGDAFTAYNQAIEDAKAAIRGEKVDDPFAAAVFINAIARKCSPHVYVNSLSPVSPSPQNGYERALTVEWGTTNARRHELIERQAGLTDDEAHELRELQWLAGLKRELSNGPPTVFSPSPIPEQEPGICWKCGHGERFSDNEGGNCEKIVDEESNFCGCVCAFAATTPSTHFSSAVPVEELRANPRVNALLIALLKVRDKVPTLEAARTIATIAIEEYVEPSADADS